MSDPEGYRFLPHAEDVCLCEGCVRRRADTPPALPVTDTEDGRDA